MQKEKPKGRNRLKNPDGGYRRTQEEHKLKKGKKPRTLEDALSGDKKFTLNDFKRYYEDLI